MLIHITMNFSFSQNNQQEIHPFGKRKRKIIYQDNEGSAHKKMPLSTLKKNQKRLEQLKYLTISQLSLWRVTKLNDIILEELFTKKEIHNEILKRLNQFITYMNDVENANWNFLNPRF